MKHIIIGYSGHAFVVCDIISSMGQIVSSYFENEEKSLNPYDLQYLGREQTPEALEILKNTNWFVAIGNNHLRKIIHEKIINRGVQSSRPIQHQTAIISPKVTIGEGTMVGAGAIINSMVKIGNGVICNTGTIIEHECIIGNFAHIAPGATLAGNVTVGERSFIGANTVIKEGVIIGNEVRIGAGSVIINDIPDGVTVVGNPGRTI